MDQKRKGLVKSETGKSSGKGKFGKVHELDSQQMEKDSESVGIIGAECKWVLALTTLDEVGQLNNIKILREVSVTITIVVAEVKMPILRERQEVVGQQVHGDFCDR